MMERSVNQAVSRAGAAWWDQSKEDCFIRDKSREIRDKITGESHLIERYTTHQEGLYTCRLCGYNVKFQSYMLRHIRGHLKIRPYQCKFCSYASTLVANLTSHISRRHSDVAETVDMLSSQKAFGKMNMN